MKTGIGDGWTAVQHFSGTCFVFIKSLLPGNNPVDQQSLFIRGTLKIDSGRLNALMPQQIRQKGDIIKSVQKIFGKPVSKGMGVDGVLGDSVTPGKGFQLKADPPG